MRSRWNFCADRCYCHCDVKSMQKVCTLLQDKGGSKLLLSQASSRLVTPMPAASSNNNAPADDSSGVSTLANAALHYAMTGDVDKLVQCFEDASNPNHESIGALINQRSPDDGRMPLDWAALLGHANMVTELLKRGVDVNSVSGKGITCETVSPNCTLTWLRPFASCFASSAAAAVRHSSLWTAPLARIVRSSWNVWLKAVNSVTIACS